MSNTYLGPAYRIESERLVIRCYNPTDALYLQKAIQESVEHLRPWMPWVKDEPEELKVKIERLRTFRASFDLSENYVYAVFDPNETELLGGTGLHPRVGSNAFEIGYWINVNHVYVFEATLRNRIENIEGELIDLKIWSILRDEYLKSPCANAKIVAYDAFGSQII